MTSFRAALSVYGAPSQNFVYADVDGHIGLSAARPDPVRQDPKDLGERPVPGWTGTHEWTGYIPYEEMPACSTHLGHHRDGQCRGGRREVPAPHRPRVGPRLPGGPETELLEAAAAKGGVTREAMSAIQMDTFVSRAGLVIDRIGNVVAATDDGRTLLARIRSWNGRCDGTAWAARAT